eukprot:Skav206385  [mRNA]  locus=scaffold834:525350:529905:- [translate_table: standard]
MAAAGSDITSYLQDRGVKTTAALALIASTDTELESVLINPLLTGWKSSSGTTIQIATPEQPIARAVLLHMWHEARSFWTASQAVAPSSTTTPTSGTTTSPGTSTTEDKIPKTLPSGTWAKLVNAYQTRQVEGQDRVFPTHQVLGAESVIARVLHEHTSSKLYCPVQLGEVLQKRTFSASGEPNPLAKKDRQTTTLTITDDKLVATEDVTWNPRSVLAILDGLESIRWLFILVSMGTEVAVHKFFDWIVKLVRSRPQKTDQLTQFWTAISWKLALAQRAGSTFDTAIEPIMQDYDTFTECMSREPQTPPGKRPAPRASDDAKGKSKGRNKGQRWNPYPARPRNAWSSSETYQKSKTWSQEPKQCCFDGIGTAAWVLKELGGQLALHLSWEIDEECILVLNQHHREVQHRGDFTQDDPAAIAELIKTTDPNRTMLVFIASAPPCPDFSIIKEDAPGAAGPEGQKFVQYCKWARSIEGHLTGYTFLHLVENVLLQDKAEIQFFAQELNANAVLIHSADLGLVNRPRLWWTRTAWSKLHHNPLTGRPLRWSKTNKIHRLHMDLPFHDAKDVDLDGFALHPRVQDHTTRIPCFTTPAPTDSGRSAPKRLRGRIQPEAKARWLEDQRQFAPWQYASEAMMSDRHGKLHVLTADIKEQLHQLPRGYTKVKGVSERSRHRLIANGWHAGVVRFLIILMFTQVVKHNAAATIPPVVRYTSLDWIINFANHFPAHIGPEEWNDTVVVMPPTTDMWDHWQQSSVARHPLQHPPRLEPGLQQAFELQHRLSQDLPRLRAAIVNDIEDMVAEWEDDTNQWWRSLPSHIAQVYHDVDHQQITQIPILLHLLDRLHCPGFQDLKQDLEHGFAVTGKLHPGPGWQHRTDSRYAFPISSDTWTTMNRHYVMGKLARNHVDPHWATLLQEILEEHRKGRLSGPYQQPSWWPVQSITTHGLERLQLDDDDICVAFAFAVEQDDKVRRCEDFRRSGHNSTVETYDSPWHNDISTYVPHKWPANKCPLFHNGWGMVTRIADTIVFAHGVVPSFILKKFCTRKAYIYFLEITAQFLTLLMLRHMLPRLIISFIDNTAGLSALQRGYGRDDHVNNVLTLAWRLICYHGWHLHFEWVASAKNISDKVSRNNFEDMPALGAQQLTFDTTDVMKILAKAAVDTEYTHGQALDDLLATPLPLSVLHRPTAVSTKPMR